jgi:adenosylmethionine-8-amino-7-oxononanoate aminotransferase
MCGLGRTGANFAIDHWGVAPDLITTGKGLGSGYFPMAACLLSDAVVDAVRERQGSFEGVHTCCGHLLGSHAASAVLGYMLRHRLVENARAQGTRLLEGLREMQAGRPSVGDVRGLGLMCGVEFVRDRATKEPFDPGLKVAERVFDACMERGLIVYPGHGTVAGARGDHLLIGPPLVVTATQVDDLLAVLAEAIGAVAKSLPN